MLAMTPVIVDYTFKMCS